MKIVVTGAKGQLGQTLISNSNQIPFSILGVDRSICDITNRANIESLISREKPDILINCAAYTNVEKAEEDREQAFLVNCDASRFLAEICGSANIPLIHISTDYVFDGQKETPYRENDATHPLNVYGESKLAGELEIQKHCEKYLILRVSSIFSKTGNNFVNTMQKLFQTQKTLSVVNDQFQCPTSTQSISQVLFMFCERIQKNPDFKQWGIYHYCNNPATSWFEFAQQIRSLMEPVMLKDLLPISWQEYATKAKRPAYSVLDCGKICENFGIRQLNWEDELQKVRLKELAPACTKSSQ